MSSIPGPVIRFIVDQPGLTGAVEPAMRQIKREARSTSQAVVSDWKRMTAQLRAGIAEESLSLKGIKTLRYSILNSVDREIAALRQKNALTNKELANLKAMTLERERQVNAIKSGAAVGITKGTEHALAQTKIQATLGIERAMDAIINRYAGGATSSLFRTFRDISYYTAQAGGAQRQQGIFGGFASGAKTLFSSIPEQTLIVGGLTAGFTALAAILTVNAKKQADLAQAIENQSAATGLSIQQVQQYNELAKITGVDANSLTMAFARMQSQLGEAFTTGRKTGEGSQYLVKVLNELGIAVKNASGNVRPINAIMSDFADALAKIPDRETRTAIAMEAMGTRGRILVQIMNEARVAGVSFATELKEVNKATVPQDVLDRELVYKQRWDAIAPAIHGAYARLKAYLGLYTQMAITPSPFFMRLFGYKEAGTKKSVNYGDFIKNLAAQEATAENKSALLSAATIHAGGKTAYELAQAEKNYSKAIKNSQGALAEQYAKQIVSLKKIVALERERASITASINASVVEMYSKHPTLKTRRFKTPPNAPGTGLLFGLPATPGPLMTLGGAQPVDIAAQLKKTDDEYFNATASEADKIKRLYGEQLDYWRFIQRQYPEYAQQAQDEIYKINKVQTQKLADLQKKQFETYRRQADSLFSDLVSGNSKGFSKKFESDIEAIVLRPFQQNFEKTIGGLLQNLDQSINGKSGGYRYTGPRVGGIFGRIFGLNLGPGGTPGTFAGPLGLGTSGKTVHVGNMGAATQSMYVRAGAVYVGGASSGPGGAALGTPGASNFIGGGFGTFFGNLNPFGGGNSFFGNLNPFGSFGSSASISGSSRGIATLWGGGAGSILDGLLVGGLGAASGNVTSEATGASSVAQGLVKALASSGKISAGAASKLIPGLGGLGMLASGISQGGVGGAMSDIAGGAEFGSMFGPIGTAIGAAVGGLVGLFNGIFGGHGWSYKVKQAMSRQAIYRPPSETFSFASNGSIAQTMQTGFGMVGNSGATYALPSNTPFWANPIYGPLNNYQKQQLNQWYYGLNPNEPFFGAGASPYSPGNPFVGNFNGWNGRAFPTKPSVAVHVYVPNFVDQSSVGPLMEKIAPIMAQHVSRQFSQFSSGMGSAARRAVSLP